MSLTARPIVTPGSGFLWMRCYLWNKNPSLSMIGRIYILFKTRSQTKIGMRRKQSSSIFGGCIFPQEQTWWTKVRHASRRSQPSEDAPGAHPGSMPLDQSEHGLPHYACTGHFPSLPCGWPDLPTKEEEADRYLNPTLSSPVILEAEEFQFISSGSWGFFSGDLSPSSDKCWIGKQNLIVLSV